MAWRRGVACEHSGPRAPVDRRCVYVAFPAREVCGGSAGRPAGAAASLSAPPDCTAPGEVSGKQTGEPPILSGAALLNTRDRHRYKVCAYFNIALMGERFLCA